MKNDEKKLGKLYIWDDGLDWVFGWEKGLGRPYLYILRLV
jgi:hypothetical protein